MTATLPPPVEPTLRNRYTQVDLHPDIAPLAFSFFASLGARVERIPDGVAGKRRYVTGKPTIQPASKPLVETSPAAVDAKLTSREYEVLSGMAAGKSNADIGRDLSLSEDTIKTHARRLFRKLGVGDRTSAVVLAIRTGIVQ